MTPGARVQAAIEVIDRWRGGSDGMDRVLTAWGRQNRYAGSGDRRAIGDLVHDALRQLRSAAWVAGAEGGANGHAEGGADGLADGRTILRGLLVLYGQDPAALFSGERHAPAPLTPAERVARPLSGAPRPVRLDIPDWMEVEFDGDEETVAAALHGRAPLDLRVNLLKSDRTAALAALAADGIAAEPLSLTPTALRVTEGRNKVRRCRAWRDGLIEIQGAASQAVADLAAARPAETVLDLCAGGGGKALALAAATRNRGRLLAHDIDTARMADLPERARRSGATIEAVATADLPGLHGQCDLVVVDAPCSGSGTWRRNADARWRLTAGDLARLCAVQARLLDQAAALCRPDGRILYATCSLFGRENGAQVGAWLDRNPSWQCARRLVVTAGDGGDGMFAALLRRGTTGPAGGDQV